MDALLFGSTADTVNRKVTVHHAECGHFKRTHAPRQRGTFVTVEDARTDAMAHPSNPCILICEHCREKLPLPYRKWSCLCSVRLDG